MSETIAYRGVCVDHLYPNCPLLRRTINRCGGLSPYQDVGRQCLGTVDPLGTDLCGYCVRLWKRRNP